MRPTSISPCMLRELLSKRAHGLAWMLAIVAA
jgi:hypothetical protein